ncbi:MAG: flavodoxin family protein [Bacillota bacterium]
MMKVLAINGSPRKGGNTTLLINTIFTELQKHGATTEMVQIGGQIIRGCLACRQCFKNRNEKCVIKNDPINELIQKMKEADVIILGSPTYFTDVSAEMKAFIDRVGLVGGANNNMFKYKIGAAVVAVRRGGATHAFDTMNHFLHKHQMVMIGSTYWNFGIGLDSGEVAKDDEGMENMRNIADNIAWLYTKTSV